MSEERRSQNPLGSVLDALRWLLSALSPLDYWRLGASVMFLVFGIYFSIRFLVSHLRGTPHAWSELLLGLLIFLYGSYRLWAAWRYVKRRREEAQATRDQ